MKHQFLEWERGCRSLGSNSRPPVRELARWTTRPHRRPPPFSHKLRSSAFGWDWEHSNSDIVVRYVQWTFSNLWLERLSYVKFLRTLVVGVGNWQRHRLRVRFGYPPASVWRCYLPSCQYIQNCERLGCMQHLQITQNQSFIWQKTSFPKLGDLPVRSRISRTSQYFFFFFAELCLASSNYLWLVVYLTKKNILQGRRSSQSEAVSQEQHRQIFFLTAGMCLAPSNHPWSVVYLTKKLSPQRLGDSIIPRILMYLWSDLLQKSVDFERLITGNFWKKRVAICLVTARSLQELLENFSFNFVSVVHG